MSICLENLFGFELLVFLRTYKFFVKVIYTSLCGHYHCVHTSFGIFCFLHECGWRLDMNSLGFSFLSLPLLSLLCLWAIDFSLFSDLGLLNFFLWYLHNFIQLCNYLEKVGGIKPSDLEWFYKTSEIESFNGVLVGLAHAFDFKLPWYLCVWVLPSLPLPNFDNNNKKNFCKRLVAQVIKSIYLCTRGRSLFLAG